MKDKVILLLIASLSVSTILAQTHGTVCPPNFVQYGGNKHCYGFVNSDKSWSESMEECKVVGGHLAQITDGDLQAFLETQIPVQYNESEIELSTGNDYIYHYLINNGIDVRGHTSIVFQVMACNDAHIALSKNNGVDTSDTYEIVIGGWGDHQSVIRDCKQCAHMDTNVQQDHPVSCTEYRPFWISWANNVIRVGKGTVVGMETFLTWNDKDPHDVNYVAVATGFGATGKWKIPKASYTPGLFWIGGSNDNTQNNWTWLPSNELFDYVNWATGAPDSSNSHHCALLDVYNGNKWRNDDCDTPRNYLCETVPRKPGDPFGR